MFEEIVFELRGYQNFKFELLFRVSRYKSVPPVKIKTEPKKSRKLLPHTRQSGPGGKGPLMMIIITIPISMLIIMSTSFTVFIIMIV